MHFHESVILEASEMAGIHVRGLIQLNPTIKG